MQCTRIPPFLANIRRTLDNTHIPWRQYIGNVWHVLWVQLAMDWHEMVDKIWQETGADVLIVFNFFYLVFVCVIIYLYIHLSTKCLLFTLILNPWWQYFGNLGMFCVYKYKLPWICLFAINRGFDLIKRRLNFFINVSTICVFLYKPKWLH